MLDNVQNILVDKFNENKRLKPLAKSDFDYE